MDKKLKNALPLLFLFVILLTYILLFFAKVSVAYKEETKTTFGQFIIPENLYIDRVYIPAVSGDYGVITTFNINIFPGNGKVFISLPPFFDKESAVSFVLAKEAVCKLFEECNNYTYLFYTDDVVYGEGFSGTAGFSLLILSFFEKIKNNLSRIHNYPITGFILPNGVIAPVSGIPKKLNATLQKSEYLVAPANNEHIIPAYTILDLLKIYFNKTFTENLTVPEEYKHIIHNITINICKNIDNYIVTGLLSKNRYYSAASYCFREHLKKNATILNDSEVNRLIKELENKLKSVNCKTYECLEIKYQVMERLNTAKNLTGAAKYWRYYTAEGWFKFMNLAQNINRRDTCKSVLEEYKVVKYIYNNLPETNNCFEAREYLAKVYSSLITYRDEKALYSIINLTKFFMQKNGFSISAYNYLQYAEDLYKLGDEDSAFYYAILSLQYAV